MSGPAPPSRLTSDPFFPRLKSMVIETTGMAFYADKDDDLARIVAARMAEVGATACANYLEVLGDAVRGADEMDALVAELTIGETYFFRHKEQFDALREVILPDVLERNLPLRRLRIWSAGCATGPEPYSIAILLRREFGVRLAGWHVSIIGTDINQKFLTRAREGRYDEWAFRSVPDEIRLECFTKTGKQWAIRPEYKALVNFQYHNLIRSRFPSVLDNIAGFDIIICRNVIIYFSRETIEALIPCFRESLVDGGWLVMGHAEPNQELFRDFRTVNTPGAVLYQKADLKRDDKPRPALGTPSPPPVPRPALSSMPPTRPPARAEPVRPVRPKAPAPAAPQEGAELSTVRHLADCGRWEEAAKACDILLKEAQMDARLHFYRAMIHEQMGQDESCEASLKRAIYLDRNFVLPHYHLGLFLLRQDSPAKASRSFRNVVALLERVPDDREIADSDGITAGHLREAVGMHMALIGGA